MHPEPEGKGQPNYECPSCGCRTGGEDVGACPECGTQVRNIGVTRE